ncbi:MAG: YHS domain-containing protein, partial [Candidatus Binatia bacterium]
IPAGMVEGSTMKQKDKVRDPVCGMALERPGHALTYQGMHFAFCSEQCKARFLAHPHLYVGYPGQPAPNQEGQVLLKRRRLRLAQALSAEGAALVEELLGKLMGVRTVTASGAMIEVIYDLLQVSLEDLETVL